MKGTKVSNPREYVDSLDGWRRACVDRLRKAARGDRRLDEDIKWGHLVYLHSGPVLLIRAEAERVLFGFWRGQRLREIESRLKPSGKYEMATIELREGDSIPEAVARRLVERAVDLNVELGDPRDDAKSGPKTGSTAKSKVPTKALSKPAIKAPSKAQSKSPTTARPKSPTSAPPKTPSKKKPSLPSKRAAR
ncbi:MAG: DUF1801 domain-containing protein [Candidatus Eisenbacteria bacterium]|uniref:DUF1801 domain-containing protein n=1 Tax=Eiseniibacteriota bacterium TaxID=2212470 RepID=A0A956M1A2_UNCEI|nr:DUF1801 domain-containing protein [Candidatus Eisenbacteria bacterium]